jgi:nitrate reductase / nitrite oxidoreductase, beta subunit
VANTFSNPLVPNVPNVFALWTYFEMLITVPAQQHTPVARPKSLLTGKDVKAEGRPTGVQAAGSSGAPSGSTCCA